MINRYIQVNPLFLFLFFFFLWHFFLHFFFFLGGGGGGGAETDKIGKNRGIFGVGNGAAFQQKLDSTIVNVFSEK